MMKRETWADLFAAYQNPLYRYLYRMCGSREVAEELLQETFYRAMLSFTLRDAKAVRAWLYKVARHLYIDWLRRQTAERTTLVETHHAGYRIDKLDDDDTTLSPLLTQETRLTLYKQIGEWGVVVGSVHATKRLFGDVRYEVNFQRKYLEEDGGFSFAVPPQLLGQPLPERKETADMWEQWKHVDDGHVAELAFSTREPMTPEKLLELLRPYNLKVLQMPVYAGELQEFSISHASAGGYAFVPHLVLRPAVQYRGRGMSIQDDLNHSVEAAKAQLPADLEWLLANGSYDGRDYDEKRLAYVKKNGITVYGAVVTGPIRELERLRQEKMFHSFQFGRIETWNW
jgi:RNA polymerase sigma factor (sigma-70 family)